MAILSFKNENDLNREAKTISFDVPDDMNIFEFRIMCIRMASAMGYTDNTIKKGFGEDSDTTPCDIQKLISLLAK